MIEGRWPLPTNWEWRKAGEIAQIVGGGTPPASDESNFADDGIPWITPADLTGYAGTYISRGRRSLSEKGLAFSGARLMPSGTVLYSSRAPIGYCVIASNPISTNQGFKSLVLRGGIMPEFIRYYLLASKDYAESLASGTTFKELSGARMSEMLIPIAPLNEQRRIVAKLDTLYAHSKRARDELSHIPRLLERRKQILLASAYSGELTQKWRYEHGIADPPFIPLTEMCTSITDGDHQAPTKAATGIPFITISAISDGKLDLTKASRFVPQSYANALKSSRKPQMGDVLFSVTGSIAIPALVDVEDNFVFQRHIAILKPNPRTTSGDFLYFILNSPQVTEQANKVATGTAQLTIPLSGLREILVPLPDFSEQQEIIRSIRAAFTYIDHIAAETARATNLIDRLDEASLAKAFRGELIPQDSNDESASVLLERVRASSAAEPVEPNKQSSKRKNTMTKLTVESVKETIRQFPKDKFSFDELRNNIPGDYESLREIVFELLDEPEPSLMQIFDQDAKAMRFLRRQQ